MTGSERSAEKAREELFRLGEDQPGLGHRKIKALDRK
jgi:hypothetical protein